MQHEAPWLLAKKTRREQVVLENGQGELLHLFVLAWVVDGVQKVNHDTLHGLGGRTIKRHHVESANVLEKRTTRQKS